jgi:predicted nucleic acid-binding protein
MLVVSDTSPLNDLILIGHDRVLPALFKRVVTAPAVLAELRHPGSPSAVRSWAEAPPPWLEVRPPSSVLASLNLGRGENEAISLAHELHAEAVLIDERKGAEAASGLGLAVTGTLGVLVLAAEQRLVELPKAISLLRATTFRATERVYEQILNRQNDGRVL